jgi:hypothetical protein
MEEERELDAVRARQHEREADEKRQEEAKLKRQEEENQERQRVAAEGRSSCSFVSLKFLHENGNKLLGF